MLADDLPPQALDVLSRAEEFTTRHAAGAAIQWHAWGRGTPLVLLHGGSGSWTHWIRNVEPLAAAGRRVIVPDLPGFGDSTAPAGAVDADDLTGVMAEGIAQVAGNAPCDIVGFSFGGLVGGLMAAAHPSAVRRVVICGTPGLGLRSKRLALVAWRDLDDPEARHAAHRKNLATLMLHDPASIDDLAIAIQEANLERDAMPRRRLSLTDILARTLPGVRCRIDGIYGEMDALYRTVQPELKACYASFPTLGEFVLIPRAGHWVQYEEAAAFNSQLLRLLAQPA
ncbi:alpha/beta fold hydrolase [Ramlibacter sp.]|uniref:alpha/beta fold hydrolase n=1 Tax=Ramlibacter sp. TaxID=1917967 RepID=UPI003D0B1385